MKEDFLKELEYLGVTARLKRLSDSLFYSIKDLYASQNIGIEPSWHLVFLYLKEHTKATMSDISKACHLSQPAATKIISKMRKKGYVDFVIDKKDGRKKQLRLSKKAIRQFPVFQKIWKAGKESVEEMLGENKLFMESLTKFENENRTNSFEQRALKKLKK